MSNDPKLMKIPGTFLGAVERLLKTAPPPKTEKDQPRRAASPADGEASQEAAGEGGRSEAEGGT